VQERQDNQDNSALNQIEIEPFLIWCAFLIAGSILYVTKTMNYLAVSWVNSTNGHWNVSIKNLNDRKIKKLIYISAN
jgi:hypothetical protein